MRLRSPRSAVQAFLAPISASLLLLNGCQSCDPELVEVAPQIAVDACRTPERIVSGKNVGGVQDCEIDFGTKDISVMTEYTVKLTNVTGIPLDIKSIEIVEELSDPAFKILAAPNEVGAGLTSSMVVGFRPNVESAVEGTIKIESNAANVEGGVVLIHLKGSGVDNGVPDIAISPPSCDFGRVAQGGVAQCSVTVENTGNRALVLDSVLLDPDTLSVPADADAALEPFGFFGRPPSRDDSIPAAEEAPANRATISFRFNPDKLGDYAQTAVILSNDPDEPEILLPLVGVGVTPPTCAAKILSVDNEPWADGTPIEPLDDVVLSAEDSVPSTADGRIAVVRWEIVDQPQGSTAVLSTPDQETTGFMFADGVAGVDLAGRYRVRATVYDDLETGSVNPCEVEFTAIPTDTFLAQLSWDTPSGDMDLHVSKRNANGDFCISGNRSIDPGPVAEACEPVLDCNFSTCRTYDAERPDWDGDGALSDGDPSLDIDDISGYGPENINVDQSAPGDYLVSVFYYSGTVDVGNTVRIYIYGQLAGEFFNILGDDAWWDVAILRWPAEGSPEAPCLEDLTDGDFTDQCG